MAYVKTIWVDDETVVNATRMNHIEDGIKNLESISLLAVSDTAPSECVEGDLYYNTTTKKIYQAIDTNTWDSEGTDPIDKILYIVFSTKTTYSLDENGDLISVGGGGAEIAISTTEPEEDEVLWIDPEEDSVEAEGTYISNTHGVSTEKGYSQEYLNKLLEYNKTHISTAEVVNGTLSYANLDIRLRENNELLKLYGIISYDASYTVQRINIATGLSNLVDSDTALNNIAILEDTTDNNVKLILNGTLSSNGTLSILINPTITGHSYKVCFMNNEIE